MGTGARPEAQPLPAVNITPSVSDFEYFLENIVYTNGFAKTNSFQVVLPDANAYFKSLLCDQVVFPSKNIVSKNLRINNQNHPIAKKADFQEDAVKMTFNIDTSFDIVDYFNKWISLSINPKSKTSAYYDDYVKTIDLVSLQNDVENWVELGQMNIRLYEAYPISIEKIPVSYKDLSVAKITVSFIFKYWDILYLPTLQNITKNTTFIQNISKININKLRRSTIVLKIAAGDLAHILRRKFYEKNSNIAKILRKVDSIPFVPFRKITRRF